jgi:hypothetical protein
MNWVRRCAWSAGTLLLGAALSGCGMPGAPLPPSLDLAVPVTNLIATRAGDQVSLAWTMPKKNTDKLLLKGNQPVHVCRKEGAAGPCISVGDLQSAPEAEGAFSEKLPPALTSGAPRELAYFVEVKNDKGRSAGPSNAAVILAGEAPGPVTGLDAEVHKDGVWLRWMADPPEAAPTAIRLHRKLLTPAPAKRDDELKGPLAPPAEPVEESLFVDESGQPGRSPDRALDKDIHFGETYEYRAQRVVRVKVDGQIFELDGPLSAPVHLEALDVFPPAVPVGLAAVAIAGENGGDPAIDLSWQPDTDADLAGYIVYRREGSGGWERISPAQPVVGPAFRDAHVQAGHSYIYAVSAIDQSGHQSARSTEAAETTANP